MGKKTTVRKTMTKPFPLCKALLLCDQVIVDRGTNKPSLIGIFDQLRVESFPGFTRECMIFVQLEDGVGRYKITVEIHDLCDDVILARSKGGTIEFESRPSKVRLYIPVPPLPLKHDGKYDFVVYADQTEIDRQQLNTMRLSTERKGANDVDDQEQSQER
jgi:hypothetical protein